MDRQDITIEWFVRMYWVDLRLIPPTNISDGQWENISPDITAHTWLPSTYIGGMRSITQINNIL